jgi:hypothetical protein
MEEKDKKAWAPKVPVAGATTRILDRPVVTEHNNSGGNTGYFVSVRLESDRWIPMQVSDANFGRSSLNEEILFFTKDKKRWKLAVEKYALLCTLPQHSKVVNPYVVCSSAFGAFKGWSTFGPGTLTPVSVDESSLQQAVLSISEDLLNQKINVFEDMKQADEKAKAAKAQQTRVEMAAKAAAESAEMRKNLEKMGKETRGSEDTCKRIIEQKYLIPKDPDEAKATCQFGGMIEISDLPKLGWIVISKQKADDGLVTNYLIRKAR